MIQESTQVLSCSIRIFYVSVEGKGTTDMAKDTENLMVTKCLTYGDHFVCKQDWKILFIALVLPILLEILKAMERDWTVGVNPPTI